MTALDTAKLEVAAGQPFPMGATVGEHGIRFNLFSRHATRVWLAIFDAPDAIEPVWEYEFQPKRHRIGDIWSIFVRNLPPNIYYKYRLDGPFEPAKGHRFDPKTYVIDPYAKAVAGEVHENTLKGAAIEVQPDWNHERRPRIPMEESIIYETHVRGLTRHPSSGVEHPGTYRALIEKIPYLKDLGVTAIELLPIHAFGEELIGRKNPDTGAELTNYWGYSNIGFFAPAGRYAAASLCHEQVAEFRRMVDAIHDAGLEVILDVVFNHTSEGNENGPTLAFRGLDNSIYYILDDNGAYKNYSGCGNTLNCNHPLVREFILDCLRYWVALMHIDGFRFDLASILGRDRRGRILEDPPLIERIAEDPLLRDAKLIAEAWDAGGAYQVGSFGDIRWAEWNGKYRDDIRRFWRGDEHTRPAFASRLTGSSDIYQAGGRTPAHSINFVTCHDGFTLRDLVSYTEKRNAANAEENRDGANDNFSMNCGEEGESQDPRVNALRTRMQKNFLLTLFTSLGVPMLLGGDEFGRTQRGNNNAYCQDNEISWYDWSLREENAELLRFTREIIQFRKANPVFSRAVYFTGMPVPGSQSEPDIQWFDEKGRTPDWEGPKTPVACRIAASENGGAPLYLLFNNTSRHVTFRIPKGAWRILINTGRPAPHDIVPAADSANAPRALDRTITLPRKAAAVLVGEAPWI